MCWDGPGTNKKGRTYRRIVKIQRQRKCLTAEGREDKKNNFEEKAWKDAGPESSKKNEREGLLGRFRESQG